LKPLSRNDADATPATGRIESSTGAVSSHYNFDRVHHGRLTKGRIPADIVYGARKMGAR
jgi:hypothetical protein